MNPRILLLLVAVLAGAGLPARAADTSECAQRLVSVDRMLAQNPKLPPADLEKAKKKRDQGEVLMKGGKAKECRIALRQAEKMLAKGLKK